MYRFSSTAIVAVFFFFSLTQAATSQDYSPERAPGEGQTEVTDSMLSKYAAAASDVQSVQQEFAAKIQSTQDASEAQSLRSEAQAEMIEAVEGSGLTVTEYNEITQELQRDPDLGDRLNRILSR